MIQGQVIEKVVEYQDNRHADRYFLYVPVNCVVNAKTLIVVHGVGRRARSSAEQLVFLAERFGVILLAPLFSEERYPDYQYLGLTGQGERADHALERIVSDYITYTGRAADKLYLFGFSGGAQFAHRFTMAYPERVARLVTGSAGWYTFPDVLVHPVMMCL
jgi:poly(3-hydroxybutyrate) depolymerase